MENIKSDHVNNSRRNFLKKALLGTSAFFVSTSPLKIFATNPSQTDIPVSLTKEEAKQLAFTAKEYFYKKDYQSAINIYKKLIDSFPACYSYYDGYARVLGSQQLLLEKTELYREGLLLNPENPYFMQRLSLSMRDLCMGNNKRSYDFVSKYGQNNFFSESAVLILGAIKLLPKNKGFYLDAKDFINLEEKNKLNFRSFNKDIKLTEDVREQIFDLTIRYNTKWENTRKSRKPIIPNNIEEAVDKAKNKRRRRPYNNKEAKEQEKGIKKKRKEYWLAGLDRSIKENQPNKAEKYGMLILAEDINDTYTIGKLRRLFKKNKMNNRTISLNRFIFNNNTVFNGLSLALVLSKYGDNNELSEAKTILINTSPLLVGLPDIYKSIYYISFSNIYFKRKKYSRSREILLEGLQKLHSNIGISYTLLYNYALTYSKKSPDKSINILKALSGKDVKRNKDDVWKYVENYIIHTQNRPLSVEEQLKPLYALAKIQSKNDKAGELQTLSEIQILKSKLA